MLALHSAGSGNQKVQVLRAATFNLIGKGTPKVTPLKGLSSFSTFFTVCLWSSAFFFVFVIILSLVVWEQKLEP